MTKLKEQRRTESAQKRTENKKKWFRTWDENKEVTEDEVSLLSKVSSGGHRSSKGFKTDDLEDSDEPRGMRLQIVMGAQKQIGTAESLTKEGEKGDQGHSHSKSRPSNSKKFNNPLKKKVKRVKGFFLIF